VPPSLRVADALQPIALKLSANLPLAQAARTLIDQRATCALVMDNLAGLDNVDHLNNLDYLSGDEELVGILTLRDVNRLILKSEEAPDLLQQPIRSLCTTHVLFAYRDETVKEAIARMGTRGLRQIPVVERENPDHVIGLLTEESITTAARLARITKALGDSEATSEDLPSDLAERNGKAIALTD
jgi:CBS domain-containing protein